MAIIRCPSCGKPNPDFLDVCQYCETPLIGGGQPGGPPPAPPTPAAAAQTIRCQACGRVNPAHLDNCQYCQARLKPMLAGSPSSAANPPAGPAANADEGAPGANLLNRLRNMGSLSTPPAAPEAAPEPEPDEPDEPSPANWMSRLRGMTDSTETASAMNAAPVEPDWMWTGAQPDEAAASDAPPPPPPTEVTPGSDELPEWLRDPEAPTLPAAGAAPGSKPRRKMTDWLNARPGNAPVEPAPVDDVPDWLKNLAGTSSGPSTPAVSGPLPDIDAPPARVPAPPPSGTSDLPDWLKNIRTSTPLGGTPDEAPSAQASAAHRMQALPEWMRTGTFAGSGPLPDIEPAPSAPEAQPPADVAAPSPAAPIDAAPAEAVPADAAPPAEAGNEDMPAWLRAIITPGAADETIPVPVKPKKKKMTDWLGNSPPPPTELPNTDNELPDWLKALSAGESAPPPAAPTNSPVAEGLPAWLQPADSMDPDVAAPDVAAPATPSWPSSGSPAMPSAPASAAPADDLPDWLRSLSATPDAPPPAPAPAPAMDAQATIVPPSRKTPTAATLTPVTPPPAPSAPTTGAADLPDWLTALSSADANVNADATAPADLDNDTLAWLNTLGSEPGAPVGTGPATAPMAAPTGPMVTPRAPGQAAAASDETLDLGSVALPAEAPAWLDELAAAAKTPPAAPPVSAAPEIQPTPEAEMPEWLKTMRGLPSDSETPPEEMPDWLRAMRGLPPMAPKERQERAAETAAILQEQAAAEPVPSAAEATMIGQRQAITNATDAGSLPSWLAAMRPVDIAQASAGEADSYEETLGVLAGMRGVLRAEPAVALPHKATPAVNRLAVSDLHNAHVRLLTELQQSEAAAAPRKSSVARVALYVERWIVFAILAVAIVVAQLQLPNFFGAPRMSPDAQAAYNELIAAGAQSGAAGTLARPVLVAFDYEAAQQGELNPAAAAILHQLMGEGVPVVGISTRATGAAVGQMLLEKAAEDLEAETNFDYVYGTHYLNLGYIPGGPIGLLQFASVPHSPLSFQSDFTGAYGVDNDVWNAPAVRGIETLQNFSLIVLISGTPQAMRSWVEQAQTNAPGVPLIAVVSAAAEPLVRPYLTSPSEQANPDGSANPQVDGLVVGLGGAAALEQQIGRPGDALAAWPGLGGGLLAAALIIAAGGLVFGLLGLVRRRR